MIAESGSGKPENAPRPPRTVVVIPCHNEETTIGKVIGDFQTALPDSEIVVVDNYSSDRTAAIAHQAGATVISESRQGKGFALMTGLKYAAGADYFIMVDGDDTYPAEQVHQLIEAAQKGADMVIGTRLTQAQEKAFRPGHGIGNRIFILLVRALFGIRTRDLFSGYRLLTSRFLETSPLIAQGFEVEAELSMQALANRFRVAEVPVKYRPRPEKSESKLNTFRDGYRILIAILSFFRDYRPLTFCGLLAAVLLIASLLSGGVVIKQYVETGQVLRIPLAILAAGLFILSALSIASGLLLSSINRRATEISTLVTSRWRSLK